MNSELINECQNELRIIIDNSLSDTVFIHSDLFRAMIFIKRSADRQQVINNHISYLEYLLSGRNIWFPTFNYQFPKTKIFNPATSVCEIGPLPEFFRQHKAQWRTIDPIFSACGTFSFPTHSLATSPSRLTPGPSWDISPIAGEG